MAVIKINALFPERISKSTIMDRIIIIRYLSNIFSNNIRIKNGIEKTRRYKPNNLNPP